MKMNTKICVVLVVAVFAVCFTGQSVFAVDNFSKDVKTASTDTVNYTGNVLNESVKVVEKTVKTASNAITGTVAATGDTLTGKPDRAQDIVTTPVEGTVKTAYEATKGTAEVPFKAGEKTSQQQ